MQAVAISRKGRTGLRTGALLGAAALGTATLALAGLGAGSAQAATSTNGTTSLSITGGALSVGNIGSGSAPAPAIGGTSTGTLPSAQWADDTGLGLGWNGQVAISPLTYTGSWQASSGAPAVSGTTGTYNGTDDGRYYTVTVTSGGSGSSTPYSWTSDATGDASGGSGTATNGSPATIGGHGITVTFASGTTYPAGSSYTILVGTESEGAVTVDTAAASTITSSGTSSSPPSYASNGSTIDAGTAVGTVNSGGAVKVLSAALGTGASGSSGYYTAAPGIQISADSNSWAKTYSGSITYSIVSGP